MDYAGSNPVRGTLALIAQLDQSATLRRWRLAVQTGLGALAGFVLGRVAEWMKAPQC